MFTPQEIVKDLVKVFDQDSRILAFTLVGSQAREDVYKSTKHSDLEAFIVVDDSNIEKIESELPSIYSKYGQILFSFKHDIGFMAIYDNLFRIETPVIGISDIKGLFNRPKSQVVKVLIDKTEGKLDDILNSRPLTIDYEKIFKDKVVNFWNWNIIGAQYLKKGELYNSRAVLNIQSSTLVKLFELLNNPEILLLEPNKRIEQFLNEDQIEILSKLTPSYDSTQIEKALKEAMEIFPKVFSDIKQKYGYEYDVQLEKIVKPRIESLLTK